MISLRIDPSGTYGISLQTQPSPRPLHLLHGDDGGGGDDDGGRGGGGGGDGDHVPPIHHPLSQRGDDRGGTSSCHVQDVDQHHRASSSETSGPSPRTRAHRGGDDGGDGGIGPRGADPGCHRYRSPTSRSPESYRLRTGPQVRV